MSGNETFAHVAGVAECSSVLVQPFATCGYLQPGPPIKRLRESRVNLLARLPLETSANNCRRG
eukprot:4599490-Pyramimonas_sp.AAC.1